MSTRYPAARIRKRLCTIQLEGVYHSRFTGDVCFALFDRGLDTRTITPLIEHEALVTALDDYDIKLTEAP